MEEEFREGGGRHGDEDVQEEEPHDDAPAPGGDLEPALHPAVVNLCDAVACGEWCGIGMAVCVCERVWRTSCVNLTNAPMR